MGRSWVRTRDDPHDRGPVPVFQPTRPGVRSNYQQHETVQVV